MFQVTSTSKDELLLKFLLTEQFLKGSFDCKTGEKQLTTG